MEERRATAAARANIALTKYWGNTDDALHIPANESISLTLEPLRTLTTVSFRSDLAQDRITLNGEAPPSPTAERVRRHLDLFRGLSGTSWKAGVTSQNNFPAGVGIASSAAGFAALTLACAAALQLDLPPRELSRWARRGSGSAARSIWGGYVLLHTGSDEEAVAEPLHGPDWWEVYDLIAVLSRSEKRVPSRDGHRRAATSPFHAARVAQIPEMNRRLRQALAARDLAALGEIAERDALMMHAVMMTSVPSLIYWLPATLTVVEQVRGWRQDGIAACFTIDAGPNVHVLTLPEHVPAIRAGLKANPAVQDVLVCRPGAAAKVVTEPHD
ncbi:MAG: diphosphomevalonate decarboxylase [Anaerolineae bacterium]|nr:diphosphomevalonate decarboxylase [Anaerolineae bacterium]